MRRTAAWFFGLAISVGCLTQVPTDFGKPAVAAVADSATVALSSGVTAIINRNGYGDCIWCHKYAPYPSQVDFNDNQFEAFLLPKLGQGVQQELAPFVDRITQARIDTIINFVESKVLYGRKVRVPRYNLPSQFRFNLNEYLDQQIALGRISSEGDTVPGWGWANEDMYIDGVNGNEAAWTMETYTDRHGITYRGIALGRTHQTSADSFPSSINPSSYFVFGFQRFHGRLYDYTIEWDQVQNRWGGIFALADTLEPPGRSKRSYTRAQVDRDAISLVGVIGGSPPGGAETWPWGGSASNPGNDKKLTAPSNPDSSLNQSGIFLNDDKWYHCVFQTVRDDSCTRYYFTVSDPRTKFVYANLFGYAKQDSIKAGVWGLHKYAVNNLPKKSRWANIQVFAKYDTSTWVTPAPNVRRQPAELQDPGTGEIGPTGEEQRRP